MRDMRKIEECKDFKEAQSKFIKNFSKDCTDETKCNWSLFKQTFLGFAKNRCPLCEDTLNKYDDIDHYRPKNAGYEFLKCCCDNYMIMCSDCNRTHKYMDFPLDDNFVATNKFTIEEEKALLINPRVDNILDYFELHFLRSGESLILEIRPNKNLDISTYEYRRAKKTIEIYGLGYCKDNEKIDGCRINIFENHYEHFIDLAKARQKSKLVFMQEVKLKPKRAEYGFIEFIAKEQFEIWL